MAASGSFEAESQRLGQSVKACPGPLQSISPTPVDRMGNPSILAWELTETCGQGILGALGSVAGQAE